MNEAEAQAWSDLLASVVGASVAVGLLASALDEGGASHP